jgi:prefoldin subunit 5
METLVEAERSGRVKPSTDDEVKALEAEVESLHSEILSIAQLSVEHQYLEPALTTVSAEGGQNAMRTTNALAYVRTCPSCLLLR